MIVLDHVRPLLVVPHFHVWMIALPFTSHPFVGIEFAWERNQFISSIFQASFQYGKLPGTNISIVVKTTSFPSDPLKSMQMSRLMKILLPLLWYPTLEQNYSKVFI